MVLTIAGCTVQEQSQPTVPSGLLAVTNPETHPTESQGTVPPATEPATQPTTVPPTTDPATEPTEPPTTEPVTQPPATEAPTEPPTTEPPNTQPTTTPPATEPEHSGGIPTQVTVEAPGVLAKSSEKAVIDYSNTKDGYVMVRFTVPTDKKLKAQVQGPTTTYTYNLTPEKWAAFPLSDENGTYKITVFQNTTGTKYAAVISLSVSVQMTDEFAPFLRSNQYVDFDAAPKAVAKAAALTAGISDPLKKVEKVYDFVVGHLTYDTELAATVKSGYLPELDKVLEKRKGICFDYAALMTGMLRSQGVPTKLVVGYAGTVYHAWISVWSEADGWVDGVIWFDGASWQRMDPTFASSGGSSSDIMDYIGNGANYMPKYFY
ncbi:MAG: transglutaminase domain-containing protein [Oscillospiraceae bacterium]|nr:transglutaminase domain-containing protein [Oscillospiraceae bacterium]